MIFERMGLTVHTGTTVPLSEWIQEVDLLRDPDDMGFDERAPGPRGLNNTLVAATCQHIVSETYSNLPVGVFARDEAKRQPSRVPHVAQTLLDGAPNPEMDAQMFREAETGHTLGWGFGLSEIEPDGKGGTKYLWPIPPWRAFRTRHEKSGQRVWAVNVSKNLEDLENFRILTDDQALVVPWWSADGYRFYSPLRLAAADIGLSQTLDEFAIRYFRDGHHLAAAVTHPEYLKPDAKKKLREHIEGAHRGLARAHRIMILDEGMGIEQIRLPLDEAKLLESRLFEWRVVAALYRISADRVNIFERTSYASLAQTDTRFAKDAIVPMSRRWERAVDRRLLRRWDPDRPTGPELYCRHNIQALLRGDPKTSAEIAQIERKNGVINGNEWRARNEDDPIPGEAGEAYLWPTSMVAAPSEASKGSLAKPTGRAFRTALEASLDRVFKREANGLPRVKATDPARRTERWHSDNAEWVREQVTEAYRVAVSVSGREALAALARNSAHDLAQVRVAATHPEAQTDDLMTAYLNDQVGQVEGLLEQA